MLRLFWFMGLMELTKGQARDHERMAKEGDRPHCVQTCFPQEAGMPRILFSLFVVHLDALESAQGQP